MKRLDQRIEALEAKPKPQVRARRLWAEALPIEQLRLIASIPIGDEPLDLAKLTDAQRQALESLPDEAWIDGEGDDDGYHS